jgi:MFS family permease
LTRRCLLAAALCMVCLQWLGGMTALALFVFALSMITTMVGTGSQALAQLLVEERFRGRVLSLWAMLAMGAPALGAVIVGAAAQAWGFPLVAALAAMLGALLQQTALSPSR